MAQLLVVTAAGPEDQTRASVPFHIAANGAAPGGVSCAVALAGDAVEVLKSEVAAEVRGVGLPPLADLIAACGERGIRFHV